MGKLVRLHHPPIVQAQNLLKFKSLGDPGIDNSKFCSLHYLNPQSNGLPIWGPSNTGITVITERLFLNQPGYFGADLWWSNEGAGAWQGGDPITGGGAQDYFWGAVAFPQPGNDSTSTTHVHAVSGMAVGTDSVANLNDGSTIPVVYGTKQVRGVRVQRDPATHYKTALLYVNLPSTANADMIQGPIVGNEYISYDYGETFAGPPFPALTIGDSPWTDDSYGMEPGSGYWGRMKIFSKVLSQADMVSESGDMSRLVTSDGLANIWWGKTNWRTIDDLACDFGTGHAFSWHDATYKATLVAAASVSGWN